MSRNSSSAYQYDDYYLNNDYFDKNDNYNQYDYDDYQVDDDYYYYDDIYDDAYLHDEAYHAYIEKAKVSQARRTRIKKTKNARRRHMKRTLGITYARGAFYLVVYGVIMVFLCVQSSMLSYDIIKLQDEIAELETDNKRLAFSIQEKSSLDRIAEIAATELGMVKPDMSRVYVTENIIPAQIAMPDAAEEIDNQTGLEKLYAYLKDLAGKAFQTGVDFLASY